MFRSQYLDQSELGAQLADWVARYPGLAHVSVIGKSLEGHDLQLLTIGREPDRARPAVWIDGNIHASELCGSSVALAIAEDVLAIHQGKSEAGGKPLPAHMCEAIREALFYVLPRMSPDGAEAVLKTGRYVRSSPINDRPNQGHAYWQAQDVDGDGQLGYMRQACAHGELIELRGADGVILDPPVMAPRLPEDEGPFYRLYPEGHIVNFDGERIPDPNFLSDNLNDFNRNFPFDWACEPDQVGAGHFPGSAPETRAVIEFATRHPHIFTWLNLHTFGGVMIRPLGDKPDNKMNQTDLAIYRQVEAWMTEHSAYACVSGYHEFLYEPDKPLHGDVSEWAYHHRGCLAYVVELWDLFKQLGIERKKPFVDHYSRLERRDMLALAKLDREQNQGRIFKRWRKAKHPQIGEVELDGFDPRVGIWNPPLERLAETCAAQSAAFLRVAALLPRVMLQVLRQERTAEGQTRVELRIVNSGYLGTSGLASAAKLPHVEPLRLVIACEGAQLLAPAQSILEIGHLEGWGQGLHGGPPVFMPWTRGSGYEKKIALLVQGSGTLELTLGSCRVGHQILRIPVGQ